MTKIAINGFGRIGRPTFRRIIENHSDLEIVAINDLTDPATLSHLLKYDSVYGVYEKEVKATKDSLIVDGREFKILAEKEPEKLPWKDLGVDVVLECTGVFRKPEDAEKHIKAGAKKVIISAPAKGEGVPSFVLGVNEEKFNPEKDKVVDMGSCTTNCLAPIAKILNDNFEIVRGFMTTIHSYTTNQKILDLPHKDLRRGRAAALNIVPTTTGAAKAIGKAMPELDGKLDGIALRVPTPTVSILDLICQLKKSTSTDEVNKAFKEAAKTEKLKGILRAEEKPLVSSDYKGDTYSAIVDAEMTMVDDNLVKVLGWYDNEYGYACRLAQFAGYIGKRL
jgi:glyceraldehyde 3-phosphate dehydrogenase